VFKSARCESRCVDLHPCMCEFVAGTLCTAFGRLFDG